MTNYEKYNKARVERKEAAIKPIIVAINMGYCYSAQILNYLDSVGLHIGKSALSNYLYGMRNKGVKSVASRYNGSKAMKWSIAPYSPADEKPDIPDLPESLLLMFGYNTKGDPSGGTFIDNADFHPTPTRTAPVRVWPGTSWPLMEMAL